VITGRRYTYRGPVSRRPQEAHELIVRDPLPPGAVEDTPRYELDGKGIGRATAAWVLSRWRRSRRGIGASLRVVRFGPRWPEHPARPRQAGEPR
jgi:hypothetical protein